MKAQIKIARNEILCQCGVSSEDGTIITIDADVYDSHATIKMSDFEHDENVLNQEHVLIYPSRFEVVPVVTATAMIKLPEILKLARHFQNDCGGMKNEESSDFDWTQYQDLADMVDILDRKNGNDDCFDLVVLIVPNFNY